MKLLLDMNMPPKLVGELASKGINAVHWYSVGAPDASDAEIISHAKDNDYVVVTHDLDFSAILSVTHGVKPSVIQIRAQGIDFEQVAMLIATAVSYYADDILHGAILSLDTDRARLHILPL